MKTISGLAVDIPKEKAATDDGPGPVFVSDTSRGHCQLGVKRNRMNGMLVGVMNPAELYRGHRFPADVISQVVWLYFRFSLSYREVEEMMARRGIELTYETVREWCDKFGRYFAEELRRRNKAKLGMKWYLDEVFLKIKGVQLFVACRGPERRCDRYPRSAEA